MLAINGRFIEKISYTSKGKEICYVGFCYSSVTSTQLPKQCDGVQPVFTDSALAILFFHLLPFGPFVSCCTAHSLFTG